jgi:hypothetical protein
MKSAWKQTQLDPSLSSTILSNSIPYFRSEETFPINKKEIKKENRKEAAGSKNISLFCLQLHLSA